MTAPFERSVTRRTVALLSLGVSALTVERCFGRSIADSEVARPAAPRDNVISVKDYGAKGNGIADDSAAIVAADAVAARSSVTLYFPPGIYSAMPVRATTSWRGAGAQQSIIRYRGSERTFVTMVSASGINNICFSDLGFDGQVSADPDNWSATTQDRFRGAAGLSIENCRGATVSGCAAMNIRQHGFRLVKVDDGRVEACTTHRSRGIYGDGFLILSSSNILIKACMAQDYTRIGFVADRTGITDPLCQAITLQDCQAMDGHHSSSQFGGTEFNAGVWLENCTSGLIERVLVTRNPDRGINACSGQKTSDFKGDVAKFIVRDCHTSGSTFGICVYSLANLPVVADIIDCTAERALIAFQAAANNGADRYVWTGCRANYDASATNGRGFAAEVTSAVQGRPSFTIGMGCIVTRWATDSTKLNDTGAHAATADIGGFYAPAGPMQLNVTGARREDGKPLYIRWYNDQAHDIRISDVDAFVSATMHGGTRVLARRATVRLRPGDKAD